MFIEALVRKGLENDLPIIMIEANKSSISLSGFCIDLRSPKPFISRSSKTCFVSFTIAAALNTARLWASSYSGTS